MRTLTIHSGGTKTGSSALQNVLGANAPALRGLGIAYVGGPAIRSAFEITSGNGRPLAQALEGGDEAALRDLIRVHLDGLDAGLVSSEALEFLGRPAWERLLAAAEAEGVEVRVIHFVRHVAPLLVSSYDQCVKRHGESRPIEAWAATHDLPVFGHLRALEGLGPRLSLDVLSYDAHRDDLARAFLARLGAEAVLAQAPLNGTERANRSLSRRERDLLRRVNARFGETYSREVSDLLIAEAPRRPTDSGYGRALADLAARRYGDEVRWVNEAFFADEPVLGIEGPPRAGVPEGGDDPDPADVVLAWALRRIAELRPQDPRLQARRLLDAGAAPRPADERLPADFDPITYLLLNPDLLNAGVPPYRHFLDHGIREGRRFRQDRGDR